MFYIIASRIPALAAHPDKKYFRVFLIGSILYVLLHYYLHSVIRTGFLEKLRKFLYHIMGVDYLISIVLLKYVSISKPEELDDDNDTANENNEVQQLQQLQLQSQQSHEQNQQNS